MSEGIVRRARLEDVSKILKIQERWDFNKLEDTSGGFLVHTMPEEEIKGMIDAPGEYPWVYDSGQVEGYLAAYNKDRWLRRDDSMLRARFLGSDGNSRKIIDGCWIYGRHIARLPEVSGRVSVALENALFKEARTQKVPYVVAEVAAGPGPKKINVPSMMFNLGKMGWRTIGQREERGENLELEFVWHIIAKSLRAL